MTNLTYKEKMVFWNFGYLLMYVNTFVLFCTLLFSFHKFFVIKIALTLHRLEIVLLKVGLERFELQVEERRLDMK